MPIGKFSEFPSSPSTLAILVLTAINHTQDRYPTLREKMNIEIGNEIKFTSNLGFYIMIVGILGFIITGIILYTGTYLPVEMKWIYYVEIISYKFYIAFIISVLSAYVGMKITNLEKYQSCELIVDEYKLKFDLGNKFKLARFNQISSFYQVESKNKIELRIETNKYQKYKLRMDKATFEKLNELCPIKIKTLGNTVQN